ncbi:MAG: Na(+)-translocating NADH-quinone reductase subunit A [Mesorhizobium sp.]|nr:Na(+)-translocating NADH-quinone reductase subunit A [Mesorhizobium sp.]
MALLDRGQTEPTDTLKSASAEIQTRITDQCALFSQPQDDFRVETLVAQGARVRQGAPVLRSRRQPELTLVAPVAGEVAAIEFGPGRRLVHILFFHLPDAGRHAHDVAAARGGDDAPATRALLLSAGMWTRLRSRPFGRVPAPAEQPSAIFVMALDTRLDAPPPTLALAGREEDFLRGLRALARLTAGPLVVCHDGSAIPAQIAGLGENVRFHRIAPVHPKGLAGLQIAALHPAEAGRPVWDVHAEDVADFGALLATGLVPETRLVSVSGLALRENRLMRCQPGADLRALCFDIVKPGPHRLLTGLHDGVEARWLGPWARQVVAVKGATAPPRRHWFSAALRSAGRPLPIIPTAALDEAFGGLLPSTALMRALAANDAETAARFGALSLIEEDLALADYLTAARPRFAIMLRAMLDRVAAEERA